MMLDDHYNRLLAQTPTMPADEQKTLAERYARRHDRRDAQRLVLGNLRLVVKLARELGGGYRGDLMDLIQEGNAGLTVAVERFDPKRGAKLSSYAALWIRAYIMRYLMETSRMVRQTSTREGRRRFFDRTLPGSDVSLDAPTRTSRTAPGIAGGAWSTTSPARTTPGRTSSSKSANTWPACTRRSLRSRGRSTSARARF
jgi:RNA polymerase sigma factor (sigma-70 family)